MSSSQVLTFSYSLLSAYYFLLAAYIAFLPLTSISVICYCSKHEQPAFMLSLVVFPSGSFHPETAVACLKSVISYRLSAGIQANRKFSADKCTSNKERKTTPLSPPFSGGMKNAPSSGSRKQSDCATPPLTRGGQEGLGGREGLGGQEGLVCERSCRRNADVPSPFTIHYLPFTCGELSAFHRKKYNIVCKVLILLNASRGVKS